ncbi:MAG: hypothetical protein KDK53_11635 [Maritimibacter sp.]|nr:hypothetical protein [Maritimibacter sp.]
MGTLLSGLLNLLILGLIGAVGFTLLDRRDLFECSAEGRQLSDEDLARAALVFRRGAQIEPDITPVRLPEGYDLTDIDAVLDDPRFSVRVHRDGDGPGGVLRDRPWLVRQVFGARFAVSVGLPANVPGAYMLWALHVTDSCGNVHEDHSYVLSDLEPTPLPSGTE